MGHTAVRAYEGGYSVVNVSSPFHREFILSGFSAPYPGFTPQDAEVLYQALAEIHTQLSERVPGRVTDAALFGYSLGGIEALFIAAAQGNRPPGALRFERTVALNPPIDLRHAAERFDAYFDAPLRWPAAERDRRVKEVAMKVYLVLREGIEKGRPVPFDRSESEFMVGFQGRTTMALSLEAIREKGGPGLETDREQVDAERGPLLAVINESSMANYADVLLVPSLLARPDETRDAAGLERAASLRAIEHALREDTRIRVVTNADDFLNSDRSLDWLRNVMGERLTVFPKGGHLGNLHRPEVQNALAAAIQGRSPPPAE